MTAAVGAFGLMMAQERKRASPRETTSATIGGAKITIEYSRPYVKGREIFGALVPWKEVWRTGADEATVLTTDKDLMVGKIHVPQGSYSLFTIPDKGEWTLILNKEAKQWGAYNYKQAQDLGRTPMKAEKAAAPVEQHTIAIESKGGSSGVLKVSWDTAVATVPITVH